MQLADALVAALRDWGVEYVFGVSGANVEHLHDSIHRHETIPLLRGGGERRHLASVLTRREDGAAFMADARARVRRTLGVCCSTSGGAMMNLAVGLAESYAESVPVLALIGQPPKSLDGRGAFQDSSGIGRAIDAVQLFQCISKFVARVEPNEFWDVLRAAVTAAMSDRPGPSVLLFPRDIYEMEVPPCPPDWPAKLATMTKRPAIDAASVAELFEAIRSAQCPTLLLGHGVRRSLDSNAVIELARAARIPVATTMSARGDFPNDDPLYLGMVGAAGHPSAHDFILKRTDLLVVAGAGFNIMTRQPLAGFPGTKMAAVNVDLGEIDRAVHPRIQVCGDVGEVFGALLERLVRSPFVVPPIEGYTRTVYRPRVLELVKKDANDSSASRDDLLQSEAIAELSRHIPENGHVVLDAGNCASAVMHFSEVPPSGSSTIALGAGGMGYGVAAAIGAQIGSPTGTRTIAFAGDGGVLTNGLEIHVAVDLGLPILFVVFNNQMHGMCVVRQKLFMGSRFEAATYGPVDFAQLARGLGSPASLWVGSAGTAGELRQHLADYHERFAHLPGVLELRLRHEEMPPFAPFLPGDEPTQPMMKRVASGWELKAQPTSPSSTRRIPSRRRASGED